MDTGPREGDLYFENDFEPGTPDYYAIERNNAIYKERHRRNKNYEDGYFGMLFHALCLQNAGKSFDAMMMLFKNKK